MNEYKTEVTYTLTAEFFELHAGDGWDVVCVVERSTAETEPRLSVPEFTVWFRRKKKELHP